MDFLVLDSASVVWTSCTVLAFTSVAPPTMHLDGWHATNTTTISVNGMEMVFLEFRFLFVSRHCFFVLFSANLCPPGYLTLGHASDGRTCHFVDLTVIGEEHSDEMCLSPLDDLRRPTLPTSRYFAQRLVEAFECVIFIFAFYSRFE